MRSARAAGRAGSILAPPIAHRAQAGLPRARVVADAPVEEIGSRAAELARSWAIALIEGAPPERMASVPVAELAVYGPELICRIAASLSSDAELEELRPARHLALCRALVPSPDGEDEARMLAALEELRGVLWEAVLQSTRARAREVGELADELAHVCSTIANRSLAAGIDAAPTGASPRSGGQTPPSGGQTPPAGGQTPPSGGQTPRSGGGLASGWRRAGRAAMVLVDEWEQRHGAEPSRSGTPVAGARAQRLEVLQERLARFLQDGLPLRCC